MPREYYQMEYQKNIKEIQEIALYAVLGAVVAFGLIGAIYSAGGYDDNVSNFLQCLLLVPMPYGIKKTWHSCLIFTSASPVMWIFWIIYMAFKLVIAIMFGLFAMPVMLIVNIVSASSNKHKMNEALPMMMQENVCYNQYSQPYQPYPTYTQPYPSYDQQLLPLDQTYVQQMQQMPQAPLYNQYHDNGNL